MLPSARRAGLREATDRAGPDRAWRCLTRRRRWPSRTTRGCGLGGRLRRQSEIGEGAIKLPIQDEPRHLSGADVEQVCTFSRHLPDLKSARLCDPAIAVKHQHALVVKFAELLGRDAVLRISVEHAT